MRFLTLFLICSLLSLPLLARGLAATVFKYECAQIDPEISNFTCSSDRIMKLHYLKNADELSVKQMERFRYEKARIILRYLDLGLRHFELTAAFWPKNVKNRCLPQKKGSWAYNCYYCTKKGSDVECDFSRPFIPTSPDR